MVTQLEIILTEEQAEAVALVSQRRVQRIAFPGIFRVYRDDQDNIVINKFQ